MTAPCLRERIGHYGGMSFVRETPLRFIPLPQHQPATPSAADVPPALSSKGAGGPHGEGA